MDEMDDCQYGSMTYAPGIDLKILELTLSMKNVWKCWRREITCSLKVDVWPWEKTDFLEIVSNV